LRSRYFKIEKSGKDAGSREDEFRSLDCQSSDVGWGFFAAILRERGDRGAWEILLLDIAPARLLDAADCCVRHLHLRIIHHTSACRPR
jgi:hypothetical protein